MEGKIAAFDTKVEQLDKRVINQELASHGILIGIVVIILGGAKNFLVWLAIHKGIY